MKTSQEKARALLTPDIRFVEMMRRGSMSVEWYAPEGVDPQQPHEQDELYVVMSGSGMFLNGGETQPFGPGDVLFVPAGG
jgi:mannose-6-phosphate isomerase-like protein (cupin superfamily)